MCKAPLGFSFTYCTHRILQVYFNTPDKKLAADWREVLGVELYDHDADPMENSNVYYSDKVESAVKLELSEILHSCAERGCDGGADRTAAGLAPPKNPTEGYEILNEKKCVYIRGLRVKSRMPSVVVT